MMNSDYAQHYPDVRGTLKYLNKLELELLAALDFRLHIEEKEWLRFKATSYRSQNNSNRSCSDGPGQNPVKGIGKGPLFFVSGRGRSSLNQKPSP